MNASECAVNSGPSISQVFATDFARLLFDDAVPHGAFRVFHYLKNYADSNGCCWPGRRRMKQALGSDFGSLQTWIGKLQKSGWLKVEQYNPEKHPFVRQRDHSKRDGFVYWLLNGDLKNPQPFGKLGTLTVGESRNGSSRKAGTATVRESRNETYTDKLNPRGTPPSQRGEEEFAIREFSKLPNPLYSSTAKSMIEGAELAIRQIKQKAKKVPVMGRILEGEQKGQAAPVLGKFRYDPPEAQAAIAAWEGRIIAIKIATAI